MENRIGPDLPDRKARRLADDILIKAVELFRRLLPAPALVDHVNVPASKASPQCRLQPTGIGRDRAFTRRRRRSDRHDVYGLCAVEPPRQVKQRTLEADEVGG